MTRVTPARLSEIWTKSHGRTSGNHFGIDEAYEPVDVPHIHTGDGEDFLWDELLEAAREDGSLLSFFVVNESRNGTVTESLYVAPDWPNAEEFAKTRLSRRAVNRPYSDRPQATTIPLEESCQDK